MPWEKRFFKGDEVWVETDADGEPVVEDDQLFMKYEESADAKIYRPFADKVADDRKGAREIWSRELEERASELEERERTLEAREQRLDEREQALDRWEDRLKSEGILQQSDEFGETAPEGLDAPQSRRPPDDIAELEPPPSEVVECYTDGACSGNPGPCSYGVVQRDGADYREWNEYCGQGTNNIAELAGIRSALESIESRDTSVRIYTDSRYAIGVLTKGWSVNANEDLVGEISDLLDDFDDVELRKVEGHAGQPLNERADELAKEALPD